MNRVANSDTYDSVIYSLLNPADVEIKGYGDGIDIKSGDGSDWDGFVNLDGKHVDTLSMAIQPNGAANWAYELVDYRIAIDNSNKGTDKDEIDYWTEYTTKYIKVGNPLNTKLTQPCVPRFCENDDETVCEPSSDDSKRQPASWVVLNCQTSPLFEAKK